MSTAVLKNKTSVRAKKINLADYPRIVLINDYPRTVLINEVLPFRVRFTSIGVEGYSSTNPPPIPLQVIGYSNYIL